MAKGKKGGSARPPRRGHRRGPPAKTRPRAKAGSKAGRPRLSKARQRRQRLTVITVIGILLVAGLAVGALIWLRGGEGEPAPDFTVVDSQGRNFTLSEQRGKVVVIDFMAATCATCVPVTKAMVKAYATHSDKAEFISLDVWSDFETDKDLNDYKAKYNADWPMALDKQAIAQDYGVMIISTILVVDPAGYVTFKESGGSISTQTLREAIDQAAAGEASPVSLDSFNNLYLWAFVLGLASFFSPCAFPLLPGYISYQLGDDAQGPGSGQTRTQAQGKATSQLRGRAGWLASRAAARKARLHRGLRVGLVTSMGLILLYGAVGLAVGLAGAAVAPYVDYLVPVVALIMIPLGLTMVAGRSFRTGFTQRLMGRGEPVRLEGQTGSTKDSSYLLYGVGYGAAATGCTAPLLILLVVAALAAGGILTAIAAFLLYGGAMGLFMTGVAVAVAQSREGLLERLKGSTVWIKQASGLVLVGVGVWLLYRYLTLR